MNLDPRIKPEAFEAAVKNIRSVYPNLEDHTAHRVVRLGLNGKSDELLSRVSIALWKLYRELAFPPRNQSQ